MAELLVRPNRYQRVPTVTMYSGYKSGYKSRRLSVASTAEEIDCLRERQRGQRCDRRTHKNHRPDRDQQAAGCPQVRRAGSNELRSDRGPFRCDSRVRDDAAKLHPNAPANAASPCAEFGLVCRSRSRTPVDHAPRQSSLTVAAASVTSGMAIRAGTQASRSSSFAPAVPNSS